MQKKSSKVVSHTELNSEVASRGSIDHMKTFPKGLCFHEGLESSSDRNLKRLVRILLVND